MCLLGYGYLVAWRAHKDLITGIQLGPDGVVLTESEDHLAKVNA